MANILAPNGFQQFGRQDGGSPTAGLSPYKIALTAAAIGFGDPVVITNGTIAAAPNNTAVGGAHTLGIFYGCTYVQASTGKTIWNNQWPGNDALAGTVITGYVVDDPDQLYVAQTSGAAVAATQVGAHVGFTGAGVPTPLTGFSTASVVAGGDAFRVVGLLSDFVSPSEVTNGIDNTAAGNFVIVAPNNFVRRSVV